MGPRDERGRLEKKNKKNETQQLRRDQAISRRYIQTRRQQTKTGATGILPLDRPGCESLYFFSFKLSLLVCVIAVHFCSTLFSLTLLIRSGPSPGVTRVQEKGQQRLRPPDKPIVLGNLESRKRQRRCGNGGRSHNNSGGGGEQQTGN